MLLWQDACALIERGRANKYSIYLPYFIGSIILVAFVCACRPFWLTNDDVSMSMIARGGGIAASPSPRLVLTNIAWGYLVQWLPDIGGIQSYTLMTYVALAVSYLVMLYALLRSEAHGLFAVAILLIIYTPALVYPQYTLVAGYLAVAGLALTCIPGDKQSMVSVYLAGILVVLSGLVRADETVLIVIVSIPVCVGFWRVIHDSRLRRHFRIMMAVSVTLFIAFQLLDVSTFASGQWGEFAKSYLARTEFTDFNLGTYYEKYRKSLSDTGFSIYDLQLLENWFYADPQVFSADMLAKLSDAAQWLDRVNVNLDLFWSALTPFSDPQMAALIAVVMLIGATHQRRAYFGASLVMLTLVMLALLFVGRPGVTRIYIPVCGALAVLGVMQPTDKKQGDYVFIVIVATFSALLMLMVVRHKNDQDIAASAGLQAATCELSPKPLVVIWGASYPYTLQYLPFDASTKPCQLRIYSLGEYSLAPFSLDQLHRYTGDKELVPALLADYSFAMVADAHKLELLNAYFKRHYSVELSAVPTEQNSFFKAYEVKKQQTPMRSTTAVSRATP